MKKIIVIISIIAVLAIIIVPRVMDGSKKSEQKEEVVKITVTAIEATKGDIEIFSDILGDVNAYNSVAVMSKAVAKVKEVNVKNGDFVNKDDILFSLDKDDVKDQVTIANLSVQRSLASKNQADAGLKNAQAGLEQAKLGMDNSETTYNMSLSNYNINMDSYKFAKDNLEKYEKLYSDGIVSENEYKQLKLKASEETPKILEEQLNQAKSGLAQAKLNYNKALVGVDSANATISQAQAGLAQSKKQAEQATDLLIDMEVKAPISGYVSGVSVTKDNYASNSMPALSVEKLDSIKITINLTAKRINDVSIGAKTKVSFTGIENEYIATVDSVSHSANQKTSLYPVTLIIENEDLLIKPGMFANVLIPNAKASDVVLIPSSAIVTDSVKSVVYVKKNEDEVDERVVNIGIDDGKKAEIIEGVSEGDIVIVDGAGLLNANSRVDIIMEEN